MRGISSFLAVAGILISGCVFDASGVIPDGARGSGSDWLSFSEGSYAQGDGGDGGDDQDQSNSPDLGNAQEDTAVNDQQQPKPLGAGCSHDNECESGYCVKAADEHSNDKICCFMDCKIDEDEDGCRKAGTECYSHD